MKKILTILKSLFYKAASIFENPLWAGLLALAVYLAYAQHVNPTLKASPTNFHNYLADAFLHGQLYLRLIPSYGQQDLSLFNQQYYLYFPPLPAILMLPFVALFGIGFSDVLFTVVIAALNVALVALLLRKAGQEKIIELTAFQRSLLVLFFAFGTVHFPVAPYGRVWFTSLTTGFFFTVLSYIAAISLKGKKAFFWTGAAVACAMMCRNTLLFAGIWPAFYLILKNWPRNWKDLIRPVMLGLLPVLVVGIGFLAYNWARFGDPFETGSAYQILHPVYRDDLNTYGFFNPHYAKRNFYYHFLLYPFPETGETLHGGSLFLLSPVFFACFAGIIKGKPRLPVLFLVATIVATYLPILFFLGHGWFTVGPRYTLDFTVPLLLLTAIGIRWIPDWLLILLSLISAAHFYKAMSIMNMIWRTP